jgi:hypothetical protein
LVAGNYQFPVLYFVTRGDIFKTWLHPVTWASHMVPIFRKAEDGAGSHEKNKDSFRYLRKTLKRKKSLILFGEGYTDDVFIRSLKIIKKGPARIGFDTMVECDWNQDVKVQAIGLNYTHPKHFRSDVLVSMGDCIHLKNYKELYEESPSKAITKLTREIQNSMQDQITYVENKNLAPFVENILILSRKGMNHFHHDPTIALEKKYNYSKAVSTRVNETYSDEDPNWQGLKTKITDYFAKLKKLKINENWVHRYSEKGNKNVLISILSFFLLLPVTIIGLVHQLIPYFLIKSFVEKSFKRDVFWSGVKLLLGALISTLYNILIVYLFCKLCYYPNFWIVLAYFMSVPVISGTIAYVQIKQFKDRLSYRKVNEKQLRELKDERQVLLNDLKEMDLL